MILNLFPHAQHPQKQSIRFVQPHQGRQTKQDYLLGSSAAYYNLGLFAKYPKSKNELQIRTCLKTSPRGIRHLHIHI